MAFSQQHYFYGESLKEKIESTSSREEHPQVQESESKEQEKENRGKQESVTHETSPQSQEADSTTEETHFDTSWSVKVGFTLALGVASSIPERRHTFFLFCNAL